ncbi:MAG: hypothetical protein ABIH48_02010 [Candidatus Falkowbacteria bacterium]
MELSILLAKVMGLFTIISAVAVLLNRKMVNGIIKDLAKHISLGMFGGALDLIVGLLIVLQHNIWSADWVGLITLFGWLALIEGTVLLLFPKGYVKWVEKFSDNAINVIVFIGLLIGIYLTYMGFTV